MERTRKEMIHSMNVHIEMHMQWLKRLNLNDNGDLRRLAIYIVMGEPMYSKDKEIMKFLRQKYRRTTTNNTVWSNVYV